jgi:hypothetical protein
VVVIGGVMPTKCAFDYKGHKKFLWLIVCQEDYAQS